MNRIFNRNVRKALLLLAAMTMVSVSSLDADPAILTEADKIALKEQLEKIQQQSDERVGGLYRRAIQDYRSAIRSDDATMDLYLKCVEKVQFEDEKKRAIEFREWKRKNKEKLKSSSMRMALRHQLSWLLLSIEAAKSEGDISELGSRAIKHLDQIFDHAEILKDHRNILDQNALSSVFAKAYKLNIKVEKWPKSSLDIQGVYEHVVMPQLRVSTRVDSLRRAWSKRIEHEGLKVERWTRLDNGRIGTKESMRSSQFEKFLTETRPDMQWKTEVDCFKAGDQRVAAVSLLQHLQKHIRHKNAPEWIEEFQSLIDPEVEGGETETAPSTSSAGK